MEQSTYISIKTFLVKYSFATTTTLHDLHKAYKPYMPFRLFVKYCKNMGVGSKSVRTSEGVQRHYYYNPKADKYLLKLFPVLDMCPTCHGKGIVEIDVTHS